MSTLTIEGDPLAIRGLADELTDRHYLGSEFRVAIIESDIPASARLVREALIDARSALQSLPADALGMVHAMGDRYEWPIRDELVAKIDRAIAAADATDAACANTAPTD